MDGGFGHSQCANAELEVPCGFTVVHLGRGVKSTFVICADHIQVTC